MSQIVRYMAHDPISNSESFLETYDPDVLANMEAGGIIFVAVFDDESRAVVKASEVSEPEPRIDGITLVTPKYVDTRTEATVAVFDALAAIVDPEVSAATADETGETAEATDPVEAFKTALDVLKALMAGGEDD